MITNKAGGLLYLRQPLVYSGNYFTDGSVYGVIQPYRHPYAFSTYFMRGASRSLKSADYKSKLSISYATSDTGFFNSIQSRHGGVTVDNVHVGRVFNRIAIPNGTDCFYSSGNMGSSNGTLTPSIPVEWTPEGIGTWPKAEVYVIQATNDGDVGNTYFRYAKYPYQTARLYRNYRSGDDYTRSSKASYWFYSDSVGIERYDAEKLRIVWGERELYNIINGVHAESRFLSDGTTFNFTIASSLDTLRIYTDPSFIIEQKSIKMYNEGNRVEIECATYANGKIYGIDTTNVYVINVATETLTVLTDACQTGTAAFIQANFDGTKVYCIVDGNVKIINTADDTVTTPANTLPSTPSHLDVYRRFNIDVEGNLWLNARKYDKDTLAELVNISGYFYDANLTHHGIVTIFFDKAYNNYTIRLFDLDGSQIAYTTTYNDYEKSYKMRVTFSNSFAQYHRMATLTSLYNYGYYQCESVISPNDIRRRIYRGTSQKDWRVFDGTSWQKGWNTYLITDPSMEYYFTKSVSGKTDGADFTYKTNINFDAGFYECSGDIYLGTSSDYNAAAYIKFVHIETGTVYQAYTGNRFCTNYWIGFSGLTVELGHSGLYNIVVRPNNYSTYKGGIRNLRVGRWSDETVFTLPTPTELKPGHLTLKNRSNTVIVTDNGNGTLSDGGTIDYENAVVTLGAFYSYGSYFHYDSISLAVMGTNVALEDGVVVNFENGIEAPHFAKDEYWSFVVAQGHVTDNLETYSASVDLYVVPYHDVVNESFTIGATTADVTANANSSFIKLDSDFGLTGTIEAAEAPIVTTGTPALGEISVDYNTGILTFHADDVGKTAVINYRWLERPTA